MDWYSWLAKSNLDQSLVYDYSLLFSENELEEDDILHFDHEFLLSMGISIAKHRLEILKLAKLEKRKPPLPVAKLLAAMKKTKRSLSQYIRDFVSRNNSAIVIVPKISYGGQWSAALMKKNTRNLVQMKQRRLMLTNGDMRASGPLSGSRSASPMVRGGSDVGKGSEVETEEIRWDFMFQDLRPT